MKHLLAIGCAGLLLAACAGTPPADEAPAPSSGAAAAPAPSSGAAAAPVAPASWKADGPFPQIRYYEIADT